MSAFAGLRNGSVISITSRPKSLFLIIVLDEHCKAPQSDIFTYSRISILAWTQDFIFPMPLWQKLTLQRTVPFFWRCCHLSDSHYYLTANLSGWISDICISAFVFCQPLSQIARPDKPCERKACLISSLTCNAVWWWPNGHRRYGIVSEICWVLYGVCFRASRTSSRDPSWYEKGSQ